MIKIWNAKHYELSIPNVVIVKWVNSCCLVNCSTICDIIRVVSKLEIAGIVIDTEPLCVRMFLPIQELTEFIISWLLSESAELSVFTKELVNTENSKDTEDEAKEDEYIC